MRPMGPLLHFHQFQTEYFRVESGVMGIELNGQHRKVYPENGEISVKAGGIHRFYIHPDSPGEMTVYLSASDSGMDYQLDRIFFENWYGYWHDALLHEGKLNFLQYLAVRQSTASTPRCIIIQCIRLTKVDRFKTVVTPTRSRPSGCPFVDSLDIGEVYSLAGGLAAYLATSLFSGSIQQIGIMRWPR